MARQISKQNTTPAQSESAANSRINRLVAEGGLISWIVLCVILMLALITYSADDASWGHATDAADVGNAVGPVGANIADLFLRFFGAISYLFPVLLALRALQILRTHFLRESEPFDSLTFILRLVGFVLVMISATSLANIQFADMVQGYPEGAGGILGKSVGDASMAAFSYTGSTLILMALFLFGLTVFADISWIALIDRLGSTTIAVSQSITHVLAERNRRQQELRQSKEALNERQVKMETLAKTKRTRRDARTAPFLLFQTDADESCLGYRDHSCPLHF